MRIVQIFLILCSFSIFAGIFSENYKKKDIQIDLPAESECSCQCEASLPYNQGKAGQILELRWVYPDAKEGAEHFKNSVPGPLNDVYLEDQ